jgi:DNA-binding transcriptional LysR family regulator
MFDTLFEKSGISLERLRTLCLIEKHGGITKAASVFGKENVTTKQSQFSRQVKDLEAFFGVDLLDRDVQPHRLTAEGKKLAFIAQEALGDLEDFTLTCENRPVRLTMGAGESLIQWMLMPNLERIREKLPNCSIGFLNRTTAETIEGLITGELDLGVVRASALTKQLDHFPLGSFGYRLFVPKKMRKKLGVSVQVSEIAGIRLALLEGSGEFRSSVDQLAAADKVKLNVELECSSSTQVAFAIGSLNYAGILPEFAEKVLGMEKVTSHYLEGFDAQRSLSVAWNPRRAESHPLIKEAAGAVKKLIGGGKKAP